jgi:uncharacterized protein (DUF1778 family)
MLPAVKETLQRAADLFGATLNQFVVQSALTAANKILAAERTIVLSERDAQTVFDLVENPPTPNQQLLVAVDRHRAFIRENNGLTDTRGFRSSTRIELLD